jgi:ATP-dependent DNA helicase
MRNYQLEGYEWMSTLWENGINGILADEMGLGKTIQTVALFCHMYEMGVCGPFMVVAPLSTVPNWCNEFKRFAPKVPCLLYHGTPAERMELREHLKDKITCDELDGKEMMNVVVTSYEIAMNDRAAFQNIMWRYIVVDEGHRLKNKNCRLIKELKQYHSANRLLLTGTPLQNNLSELWSLLNFLLPEIFDDLRVFESWFNAKDMHEDVEEKKRVVAQEQQSSILTTLHQILTPFLLRRVKTDVDLEIPPKKEVLVYCPLTERQKDLYRHIVEKTIGDFMASDDQKVEEVLPAKRKRPEIDYSIFLDNKEFNANDEKFEEHIAKISEYTSSLKVQGGQSAYTKEMDRLKGNEKNFSVKNRMMDMRKAVNHPYLIEYPISDCGTFYNSSNDMIDICGKLAVLNQMLTELIAGGHKTLIFSQMTSMLDVLGDYLNLKKIKFVRLDGNMKFFDRQANIDLFNSDPETKVFLLSTRAGGLGINLTAADTCIIYDSDWNPQQDLQAQDRCHRIGQTKPVMIYRLVTANTIDQKIVERAAAKRKLEKMIIHKSKFKSGAQSIATSLQTLCPTELLTLLDSNDHVGTVSAEAIRSGKVFTDEQLSQLLDRSDLAWGDNPHNPANKAVSKVEGIFTVIDQDEKKTDLGSVKE